jgi:hypothetical protein
MSERARLPNRRASITLDVVVANLKYTATISFFPGTNQIAEIFLTNHRASSDAGAAAADSAVVFSIAVQHGVPAETIRKALMRDERGAARTPLGAVLDLLAAERER